MQAGSNDISLAKSHAHHTPPCRRRFENIFRKAGDKRMAAFDERAAKVAEKLLKKTAEAGEALLAAKPWSAVCTAEAREGVLPVKP